MPSPVEIAARIRFAGDPLQNPQVMLATVEGIARSNTGVEALEAIRAVLGIYITNMLELANAVIEEGKR